MLGIATSDAPTPKWRRVLRRVRWRRVLLVVGLFIGYACVRQRIMGDLPLSSYRNGASSLPSIQSATQQTVRQSDKLTERPLPIATPQNAAREQNPRKSRPSQVVTSWAAPPLVQPHPPPPPPSPVLLPPSDPPPTASSPPQLPQPLPPSPAPTSSSSPLPPSPLHTVASEPVPSAGTIIAGGRAETVSTRLDGVHNLGHKTTLLIIAHNRPQYLDRCLQAVVKYHPGGKMVPVIVSEDREGEGQSSKVTAVVAKASNVLKQRGATDGISHIRFPNGPRVVGNGYARLAAHYKWALQRIFENQETARVIILEEDLEIASDFFQFFGTVAPLLDDPAENLLAVSAFNDNGLKQLVDDAQDSSTLLRSDFFPGLGWMLTRSVWQELQSKWPENYWDDWLRGPNNRKGRQIIRPEIPRTLHFGTHGTSNNQFGSFLSSIVLHSESHPVDWHNFDIDSLRADQFEAKYAAAVRAATPLSLQHPKNLPELQQLKLDVAQEYCLGYKVPDPKNFDIGQGAAIWTGVAEPFGLMHDVRGGTPRSSYNGIVQFRTASGARIYIAPDNLCS